MNQITDSELEQKTKLIQHYEDAFINNVLNIGKELKEIRTGQRYKHQFGTWTKYIEQNFRFSYEYADKAIQAYEKFGQNSKRFGVLKQHGMRVLILSLSVQDDFIDEVIEELSVKPEIKSKEAVKILKRFSNQVGEAPRHSGNLSPVQRKEEHLLKLQREAEILKDKFEDFKQIKTDLMLSIDSWQGAAKKFSELVNLKEDLDIILMELK